MGSYYWRSRDARVRSYAKAMESRALETAAKGKNSLARHWRVGANVGQALLSSQVSNATRPSTSTSNTFTLDYASYTCNTASYHLSPGSWMSWGAV